MKTQPLDEEKLALQMRVQRLEADLAQISRFDPLTGLLNRLALLAEIDSHISKTYGTEKRGVVVKLAIGPSAEIPGVNGQHVDDYVMSSLANRLSALALPPHLVGRIDTNRIAILLPSLSNAAEALTLVKQLLAALGQPLDWYKHMLALEVTAGIVMLSDREQNSDAVLQHAELALKTTLLNGAPGFALYSPDLANKTKRRNDIFAGLKNAIANDQLWLAYQAIIETRQSTVVGFEALLRFRHPDLGDVTPLEFIPIAEETGLIAEIGAWVLDQACRTAKSWPDHINLLVNISPEQFYQGTVVNDLHRALAATQLPAYRVEIEITESAFLQDSDSVLTQLNILRDMGCLIVLDDLGTGYSNLSYLWKFPFSKVKIDRGFIAAMNDNPMARSVVQSIISLATNLSLKITAEGIETLAQAAELRNCGVHYLQGFYFSVPVPEVELASIVIKYSLPGPQLAPMKKLAAS